MQVSICGSESGTNTVTAVYVVGSVGQGPHSYHLGFCRIIFVMSRGGINPHNLVRSHKFRAIERTQEGECLPARR